MLQEVVRIQSGSRSGYTTLVFTHAAGGPDPIRIHKTGFPHMLREVVRIQSGSGSGSTRLVSHPRWLQKEPETNQTLSKTRPRTRDNPTERWKAIERTYLQQQDVNETEMVYHDYTRRVYYAPTGRPRHSQCSGSTGSGSTGSTCFWASRIRIH
jgi:hypothetical protein